MSIMGTVSIIQQANAEAGDALANVKTAQESIERTKRALFEAMGDATPERLQDYMASLNNATATLDRTADFVRAGMEKGQEQIGVMLS